LEERETWAANDPILRLADALKRHGVVDEAELMSVKVRVVDEFNKAVVQARNAPLPTVQDLTTDVLV
jgi:TPP-dependent pyruvate/acetoin dehydrogenase alpha subunit